MAGLEPAIPARRAGVSPQHFTCRGRRRTGGELRWSRWRESNPRSRSGEPVCHHNTSPAAVGPRPWTRVLAGARASWGTRGTCRVTATVGRTSRRGARIVGRVGIEPTSGRFKKPLQGQHLLPTHRPTLWDRTRTSWASARRADRLRKSGREPGAAAIGNRGRRRGEPAGRARWLDLGALRGAHVVHLFSCQGVVGAVADTPWAWPRSVEDAAVPDPGVEPGVLRVRAACLAD